jgi:hypothetical protein
MRGMMTNSIDRDQWLNVTSESRVKLMRARIFESFPLAPFRISGTHAPCYYPHGVASSTLRYYPSTEPITAPRKPIDQRPRPIPDQSSDVDRPLYKRNVHPGQFPLINRKSTLNKHNKILIL